MRSRDWLALGALTVAAAVLRLATLDLQGYWFDEALTAELLRRDFAGMLHGVHDTQLTPPLYYAIAWAWAKLFGVGEVGLRSLSALCSVALVPLAYVSGRLLAGRRGALAAAALASFSPLLIWYSQEARPYSLLILLAGLSLLAFLRLLSAPSPRLLALWTAASVLALLTHYFAVFAIAPELAALLLAGRLRRGVVAAGAVIAAVGFALAPLAHFQAGNIGTGYITNYGLGERLWWLVRDFLTGVPFSTSSERGFETALALCGLLLIALASVTALRGPAAEAWRPARAPLGVGLATIAAATALAVIGVDFLNTRNMLAAWLPLGLAAAALMAALRFRAAGAATTAALCAIGLAAHLHTTLEPHLQRSDWRGVSEALGPAREARVIAAPPIDGQVTLGFYRPRARLLGRRRERVGEVDFVSVRVPGTRAAAARPGPPATPSGFHPAGGRVEPGYLLFRFRARPAVTVGEADVRGLAPYLDRPAALLEPSEPSGTAASTTMETSAAARKRLVP